MTTTIKFQTTDGISHAFCQSDPQRIQTILNSIKQPAHLFENTLIISTSLCTSLFAGNTIAKIEVTGPGIDVRNLVHQHKIQLTTIEADSDFSDVGVVGNAALMPHVEFHFLGSNQFSVWIRDDDTPRLTHLDILQRLANILDAKWLYYSVGVTGIGLINMQATTRIDIYMEQLVLPEGTWHTECIYC
jgi:hypothetical protein